MTQIFSKIFGLDKASRDFYQFLGIHSFLIGLFPFFVPVYLWKLGFSLSGIAFFIAITGFSFCLALWYWDRLHKKVRLQTIILLSFIIEVLLLASVYITNDAVFLPVFAILNGLYNCFFWLTQRALFFETINHDNSGRKFGNFQIFVVVGMKAGVLIGGVFLELAGYSSVFILSIIVATLGFISFHLHKTKATLSKDLLKTPSLSISGIISFKDNYHSRPIFIIDGLFLFLESYFWVISLFLLAHESFWKLGILVILLGGFFSIIFFLIKNTIDKTPVQRIFIIAVILYALSWLLRSLVSEDVSLYITFIMLVSITFCTSLFRLAFNKRFFDLAKSGSQHQYLIIKSYYSQLTIGIFFMFLGVLLIGSTNNTQALSSIYLWIAPVALLFLLYRPSKIIKN